MIRSITKLQVWRALGESACQHAPCSSIHTGTLLDSTDFGLALCRPRLSERVDQRALGTPSLCSGRVAALSISGMPEIVSRPKGDADLAVAPPPAVPSLTTQKKLPTSGTWLEAAIMG